MCLKEKLIKVIVVEPNREPYIQHISNTLKSLQQLVEGLIEYVNVDDDVDIICNEEGKMYNLQFNRILGSDVIAGTFIIAGVNTDTGETTSIPDEKIQKYMEMFSLLNHQKKIDYLKSEFIESSNLARIEFKVINKKE